METLQVPNSGVARRTLLRMRNAMAEPGLWGIRCSLASLAVLNAVQGLYIGGAMVMQLFVMP